MNGMFQWFDTVYQDTFLIKLVNMSITASLVILVLIGIRFFMRKAPKVYSYALWGIVLFRLLCPVSFSSEFSAFRLLTISESDAETGQEFSRPLALNEYDTSGEIIENAQPIHQNDRPIYQPIVKDTILIGGKDSAETVDTETVGAKQATVSSEKRNPGVAFDGLL